MADFIDIQDAPATPGFRLPLFSSEHYQVPYGTYAIRTRYIYRSGKIQVPVAGPAPADSSEETSRVLRLHKPVIQKVVEYEATRSGLPPLVPNPETSNPNEELLEADIDVLAPPLGTGGERNYKISGLYTYALKKPVWVQDGLGMGTLPYTSFAKEANILGPQYFVNGLI